jgi:hypothetical protein
MDDLAEDLRQVFAEEAEHAPPGLSLLATTHARYRRRSRRQVVGRGGVIVAAAVAATALGASLLASPAGTMTAAGQATPTQSTATPTSTPTQGGLRFVPATSQPTVSFPFSPTFVPAGLPKAAVFRVDIGDYLGHHGQANDRHWIHVQQHAGPPDLTKVPLLPPGAKPQNVTVRGRAGKLVTSSSNGTPLFYLYWSEQGSTWLSVEALGVSRTDVIHYADGLQAKELAHTEAFHFGLLPTGMHIRESLHWSEVLAGASASDPEIGVAVNLSGQLPNTGEAVRVGSHNGRLTSGGENLELQVQIGPSVILVVILPPDTSKTDAIAFAAAITVNLSVL